MIYLLFGIAIIVVTNLGALSILIHYMDRDMKEEYKRSKKKKSSRKKGQTGKKKCRRS